MKKNGITLKNEHLTVEIANFGAEITSIRDNAGREYLHQPNPKTWNRQAPVLFPISGHLAADKIMVDGVAYPIGSHGFAKDCIFKLDEQSGDGAVFSLESNDETKKMYPYDFKLQIAYRLIGKSIEIAYRVTDTGMGNMFFSIGSHEGYLCEGGLSGYEIHFEKKEKKPYYFEGHDYEIDGFSDDGGVLKLSDALFEGDKTIVFENVESDAVTLEGKDGGTRIKVDFKGFDNLFIWSRPGCDFVCIEPWCGMAESGETAADISVKPFIRKLESGGCFEISHTITFDWNNR